MLGRSRCYNEISDLNFFTPFCDLRVNGLKRDFSWSTGFSIKQFYVLRHVKLTIILFLQFISILLQTVCKHL